LTNTLGREPTRGELYIAHFLGPREATRFIELAAGRPDGNAAKYFPAAARANPSIFGGKAKPRTLAQVYGPLVAGHANAEFAGMAGDATGGRPWQVEVRPAAAFGQTFAFAEPSPGSSASKPGLGGVGIWGTIVQQTNDIAGIGEAIAAALHPGEIRPARSAPAERRELVQRALQPAVPTRANAVRVTPSDLSFLDGGLFASPEKKS
jgi:hypothetical protein